MLISHTHREHSILVTLFTCTAVLHVISSTSFSNMHRQHHTPLAATVYEGFLLHLTTAVVEHVKQGDKRFLEFFVFLSILSVQSRF